jgi:ribonuclease R
LTSNSQIEQRILRLLSQPGYRPLKPRALAEQMHLPREQWGEVKRAVKRLAERGQLVYGGGHLVYPASAGRSHGNRLVGVFRRAAKGYGFVRPKSAGTNSSSEKSAAAKDIYISARGASDAATGDVVLVELLRPRPGEPGPRGRIVEVLQRQTQQFVGTYFERGGSAYVRVDGALFAQPIHVGDPGAKNAQPDDKVVFEMLRFPSPLREGEGVIIEVLGPRGKPGVDTLSIIREFGLPDNFPEDVLAAARAEADRFDETALDNRLDLTNETIITIDPVDARDFDDAISLERAADGGWRLGVHIADVSHFVRPHTPLDREAYRRATSVYLPDRVLPMLPEVISNGLASLQPGKVRYTKTVFLEFTPEGARKNAEFHRSAICSTKRLCYEQVDAYLADPAAGQRKLGKVVADLLDRMKELAMLLRRRRLERGALELTMPEVKVELDSKGRVRGARVIENTVSHQVIEEFMLAANEAVAERLQEARLCFLRRIHNPPTTHKLHALAEFVAALGFDLPTLHSRADLQRLLAQAADRPEKHAVNFAVLLSLQRAVYGPEEEGHYALASDCYCHFTSPIRRYPDLTVHRLLDAVLGGRRPRCNFDELVAIGRHCSECEQRAERAERELTNLKLLSYLSTRLGEQMDALVTGVEGFGLFVQGIDLPAEGLIHVDSLGDDYYYYDRATHSLTGQRTGNCYRLGDLLRVEVAAVDLPRREMDFRLVERTGKRPSGKPPRASYKPPRAR